MDWIRLAQGRDRWLPVTNTVMYFRVSSKVADLLTSCCQGGQCCIHLLNVVVSSLCEMTSDCVWWCETDVGQAVFACFKAGLLWAFAWRDWEKPRISSVRIQSAGRVSKLGHLECEVLLRSTTLKNYTFQAVITRVKCSYTVVETRHGITSVEAVSA